MPRLITMQECIYSKYIEGLGRIQLRHVKIEDDLPVLYQWFRALNYNCNYKYFTLKDLYNEYEKLIHYSKRDIYMGLLDGKPVFLMDKFKSTNDEIAKHYSVKESDYGMRFLIAPSHENKEGFSWHVLTTIVDYFFSYIGINRIVTYSNSNKENYQKLIKRSGFKHLITSTISYKETDLFSCDRNHYQEMRYSSERLIKDLSLVASHTITN